MINNQNLAVLSEKVARLESAVKNSDDASEISYDNTESYLSASNVQAAIDELAGIVSSGSNANGTWIKFADGTLICTKTINGAVMEPTDWTEWGSLYYFSTSGGLWAETFYSAPSVSASNISADAAFMVGSIKDVSTTGLSSITIVRPTAPSVLSFGISIIAVGRWKA